MAAHQLDCGGLLAREMGVSKGTISRVANRAMGTGWLVKRGREYSLEDTEEVGLEAGD